MSSTVQSSVSDLAPQVQQILTNLVEEARKCFGADLRSIVLFGSGAEGRLRTTSDLNLMFVLKKFDKKTVDSFREPMRTAYVAGHVTAMFILESELPQAAEAFAVKFDDIGRRRRILYGEDLIAKISISRSAKKSKLCQILLNLALKLRERYAMISLREEQLALVIAETAGPLRSAAATLLELEEQKTASPKEALQLVANSLNGANWSKTIEQISIARESRKLPPGAAAPAMFQLMELIEKMRLRTERLN
jgi:predicted nucleotidyltransferase